MSKKRFFSIIIILCGIVFFYLQYQVVAHKDSYEPVGSDCIVVLGHSLEDGELPGNWLIERLQKALYLYENNFSDKIIVTGGMGPHDTVEVAVTMKNWLVAHHVPADHILVEDKASDTFENMKFSKELAIKNNINSIIVVTNDFHMYRSMLIASDYFKEASGSGAYVPFGMNKLFAYLKEPLSIIKYKFFISDGE